MKNILKRISVESTEGPSRKYYKLTVLGKSRLEELKKGWIEFSSSVSEFIKECEKGE